MQPLSVLQGSCNNGGGDSVSPAEAGYLPNFNPHGGILLQHVHSTQEGRWSGTGFKHLNRYVKSEHFKMEGLHIVQVLLLRNN